MARRRVVSSFVISLGVLALLVAFSLRKAGAAAETTGDGTTLVVHHPVAGLIKGDTAAVHIVNLGRDHNAAAESFDVMFVDPQGTLLVPEQHCNVDTGDTCTIMLPSISCPAAKGGRCVFRAVVVGEQMACVTPNMGTGEWMTNLEMIASDGSSRYIAGETEVLKLPTDNCTQPDASSIDVISSPDAGTVDLPPPDAPAPDAPAPDAPSPDMPPPDAPAPDAASMARPTPGTVVAELTPVRRPRMLLN